MLAPVYSATHLHWFPMELKRAYSNNHCLPPMPLPWCYTAHVCWVFCVLSFFASDVASGAVARVLRALQHVFATPLLGRSAFVVHEPCLVRFEGMWAHWDSAFAPDKAKEHVNTCPAAGFWAPGEQPTAWVSVAGLEVPILYTTAWDGAALGRPESILRFSPKRDKRLLRDFFSQFTLADFVIHEVFSPPRHTTCPIPCVLVARFKDNVPMAFVHVQHVCLKI